jgi:hypothetical protein
MRILIRTSKWAIWARRLGSFALPLAIIPVFMHRERLITSADFHIIELVAAAFALFALILAMGAFARLWVTGDQGWARAAFGLVFALICLIPMAFVAWLALHYPAVGDVSTSARTPLPLVSSTGRVLTEADHAEIAAAFPNALTRSYPIEAEQMFEIVEQLAAANGWEPRARRAPTTPLDVGTFNGIATTLLGWRDEVAIRVQGTPSGSDVDMRSSPIHGWSDLGENGRRVEQFLLALDARITLMLRDAPQTPAPAAENDAAAPAETDGAPAN